MVGISFNLGRNFISKPSLSAKRFQEMIFFDTISLAPSYGQIWFKIMPRRMPALVSCSATTGAAAS